MKSGLVLLLAGSVTAFAPAAVRQQQPQHATATTTSNTALNLNIDSLPGATKPLGQWDPLGLAELGSASTAAWFRAAELKHARVAMLAVTGYIVQAAGYHFPGMLSSEVSFESLSTMKPLDAWCAVPSLGQMQIIGTIALAEFISEAQGTHYTKGGPTPTVIFPPIDFSGVDPAQLERKQKREINNGRLAMISIMSFIAAANVPGSVPLLDGNPMF